MVNDLSSEALMATLKFVWVGELVCKVISMLGYIMVEFGSLQKPID